MSLSATHAKYIFLEDKSTLSDIVMLHLSITRVNIIPIKLIIHSSELEKNKVCLKNRLINKCSPKLFEDVVKVLQSTLMTKRFFCQKVDLDLQSIDNRVKGIAPCKDEFFDAAETCAKNFRSKYIAAKVKKEREICV